MSATATNNWGRWGREDERGCLNLIDAAAVLRGTASARSGEVIELGHAIGSGRSPVLEGRRATTQHFMIHDGGDPEAAGPRTLQWASDALSRLDVHSTTTHVDGLGHGWSDGRLYNGFPAAEVNSRGARRCGVKKMVAAVGVLHEGADFDPEALIEWCEAGLAYFKVPRYLEQLDDLPHTAAKGDPDRAKLRELGIGDAWERPKAR